MPNSSSTNSIDAMHMLNDDIMPTATDILSTINININTTNQMKTNCLMQSGSDPSQQPGFRGCPVVFDSARTCWPSTAPNTTAFVPCFTEFLGLKYDTSQNASRLCYANGTWEKYANYDQCDQIDLTRGIETLPHLEYITHIWTAGYTLSLVSLILGIAIFIHFKDLRCLRNTIHANLFSTYILTSLLWLVPLALGLSQSQATGVACKFLVVLLHYFRLTNFFWMLVEGLYLYMLVVQTFSGDDIKFKMYAFIGWGCPAIITTVWTAVKSFVAVNESDANIRVEHECTWMNESYVDWIFHGTALACMFVNVFFLIRIMWCIVKVLIIKLRSANTAETRQYKTATKALLVLIPLLGISYIMLLQGPTDEVGGQMITILQAIFIPTQGFSVSLLYCFLNSEVKQALRHRLSIWRERRNIGNDTQMDYRKHRNGLSKEYSSPRSRTESIRLTCNSNGSTIP